MKQKRIKFTSLLLLTAAVNLSYGQYINKLYDNDSTSDWGVNVFVRPDNTYLIIGTGFSPGTDNWKLLNMIISNDGNTVISNHIIIKDSYSSLYSGAEGAGKYLNGGGYITSFTIQYPNSGTGYLYSSGGIIKYNDIGDTVFIKTYTDTSIHFDGMNACAILPDGDYIVGGYGH